jgi:hypothetical protein
LNRNSAIGPTFIVSVGKPAPPPSPDPGNVPPLTRDFLRWLWMTKRREKILAAMFRSVPEGRIIAAAVLIMRQQLRISDDKSWTPSVDDVYDWIDQQHVDLLLQLREIAEGFEDLPSEH